MISGVTQTGFVYNIDENIGDDYEILKLMKSVRDGDQLAIIDLIERILGPEQNRALEDHCRTEDGRISTAKMNEEIVDIFNNQNDVKK